MKICSYGGSLLSWLRDSFVLSKTVFFIWGLVLSHTFVKQAVVNVLADYLLEKEDYSVWQVVVLGSSLDGIAGVLQVGVLYLSTYTGRFLVIILCTAANTLGLAILWLRGGLLIFPIVLTVFGTDVEGWPLRDFFDYQLSQRSDQHGNETTNLWWHTATISGSVIAFLLSGIINYWSWKTTFLVSFSIMGAAILWFMCGCFCYCFEERRRGRPLNTVFVVFKEAIKNKKRGLTYPSSEEGYHSNTNNHGSNNPLCWRENSEVHLFPREPSCLKFLDRAAISRRNSNNAGSGEGNEAACTAENVRDVKSLYPMIPLGLTFFAYSLVATSGYTYFVLQTSNLDFKVGNFEVPIMVFFQLRSLVASGVREIQSRFRLVRPIRSMAFGMFCSVLCCIAAFLVERRRLYLITEEPNKSLSFMVLTPQYLLLGLMKGLAQDGLGTYMYDRVAESMRPLVYPFIEMLLAIGAFSSVIFTFVCRSWIKESIDDPDSRLDWYYMMLASLSLVFFVIYVWYAKFRLPNLDRIIETNEGSVRRTSQIELQQGHVQNQRKDRQEEGCT